MDYIVILYGTRLSSSFYVNSNRYPNIYASEDKASIDGEEYSGGLKASEQTEFVTGISKPENGIYPYHSAFRVVYYEWCNYVEQTYCELLMPSGGSTNIWVASRCICIRK
jgi:hypothetical protein